jgi:hypothetical protein
LFVFEGEVMTVVAIHKWHDVLENILPGMKKELHEVPYAKRRHYAYNGVPLDQLDLKEEEFRPVGKNMLDAM